MKTYKTMTVFIITLGMAFRLHSQGYIVPNGVSYGGYNSLFGSLIEVLQNPTNGNYTGFYLQLQSGNSFQFFPLLDEGVRSFIVSLNDPVSLPAIQAQTYPEIGYTSSYNFVNGVPFYLGFYTGEQFPQNGIYPNPLFGWARLVNNNGVINLLDGALEYGGGGIYAGTQTIIPVPEPGSLGLLTLGGLLLGWFGRRTTYPRE